LDGLKGSLNRKGYKTISSHLDDVGRFPDSWSSLILSRTLERKAQTVFSPISSCLDNESVEVIANEKPLLYLAKWEEVSTPQ